MFRQLQVIVGILIGIFLLSPLSALAAFNDVTLTTDAVISVGGYTLNVTGSSAAIQSIVVNTSSFSVTLGSGSSLMVTSPTLQQLSSDIITDVTDNTCTGSASSITLEYSGGGTVTNVITPLATVCTTAPAPAPSGGGGGVISGPLSVGYQNKLASGTTTPGTTVGLTSTSKAKFARLTLALKRGMKYAQVKVLQQMLNGDASTQVATIGPGSPGQETALFGIATEAAVKKFQQKYGIVSSGTPATTGYGAVGPKTRARLNALYSL